jgi:hypothetical protein
MLLRGKRGHFIVVERRWYDFTGIARQRGRAWKIVAQHDDQSVLIHMGKLTDKLVTMMVNHTHEENGEVTNVREWELNNDQPSREG